MGVGGGLGSGLVMARHAKGDWSLPSAVSQTYVGAGPSFGVNVYSSVRVLKKKNSKNAFSSKDGNMGCNSRFLLVLSVHILR